MPLASSPLRSIPFAVCALLCANALAADLIVSAQDGKFVRVEGKATFPQPAPPDSLVLIDIAQSPPAIVATLEGLKHTVQGPPQAVAITPDGKLAIVAAPTRYDYDAKKDLFDTFVQVVDLEASPPALFDVERALAVYALKNGKLVDTGMRIKLAAGPVSIRSMPR